MATAVGGPLAIPVGLGVGLAVGHRQRHRRGVSARAVDDLHAGRQRAAARPDGGPYRRFRSADRSDGPDGLIATGRAAGPADGPAGVGVVVGRPWCSCCAAPCSAAVCMRSAIARPRPISRASAPAPSLLVAFGSCGAVLGARPACCSPAIRPRPTRAWAMPTCCPAIAAVVIGGTHILGGRGRYAGTVVGTILITLLSSVLSVMQMPEAGRQIIYGLVIIAMLLAYGRSRPGSAAWSPDRGRRDGGVGAPRSWCCRRAARVRAAWYRESARGRTRTVSRSRNSGS